MSYTVNDGGVRTLWRVSLPMILSFLSMLGMVTIDRLFLATYSPVALGAAASAGTTAWAFTFGGQTLTGISAVFVAQHNGAERYKRIGEPVWQMLWLSLILAVPCVAAGIWLGPIAFADSPIQTYQVEYFRWMMGISPLFFVVGALNGFFIGRGRTRVITWLSLLGNSVNLILDPMLIFGWGPIPEWGISGACLATGIGLLTQIAVAFWLFLLPANRESFQTNNWTLRWPSFRDCVRVGSPEAVSTGLELGAWGMFYCLMSDLSATHILTASVGQSLLMALFWFGVGLESGVSTVCGNLIGAGKKDEVPKLFRSALKVTAGFGAIVFLGLTLFGDQVIAIFLSNPENLEGGDLLRNVSTAEIEAARVYVKQGLYVICGYMVIETIRCICYGLLRAAGDTMYLMLVSIFSTWTLLLLPTYVLMTLWQMPVVTSFAIWLTYAMATTSLAYGRFAWGSWRHKSIMTA